MVEFHKRSAIGKLKVRNKAKRRETGTFNSKLSHLLSFLSFTFRVLAESLDTFDAVSKKDKASIMRFLSTATALVPPLPLPLFRISTAIAVTDGVCVCGFCGFAFCLRAFSFSFFVFVVVLLCCLRACLCL
eukprot:Opistho-2@22600